MFATIADALAAGHQQLAGGESSVLDAQVLLAHVLGHERSWLLAHPEAPLDDAQGAAYQAAVERLAGGEPLPYILGEWEFFGLTLGVSPAVLIPRPETELLVETALAWLAAHPGAQRVADVGTGSGCIPVALAANAPGLQVQAGDISLQALAVAEANVARHVLGERVHLVRSDLMGELPGPYDVITANLPYIPESRLPELEVSRWEPAAALGGGLDGLQFIRPFLDQAAARLSKPGLLLAEIDFSLETTVQALGRAAFPKSEVEIIPDLADVPRLLSVRVG
jgi:release factor glutamine methyltransferase